jgi:hypothetical protein
MYPSDGYWQAVELAGKGGMAMRGVFLLSVGVVLGLAASSFAYQATNDSSRSIVVCARHNGGGLYVASKCVPHARRLVLNVTGSQNLTAAPGTTLFAQVTRGGTINASSPGVTASQFSGHTGTYRVDFGQDISHCAATATLGALPFFGTPGASTTRAVGFAVVDMFAPGYRLPNGYPSGDTAEVEIRASGVRVNAPFYIVVSC